MTTSDDGGTGMSHDGATTPVPTDQPRMRLSLSESPYGMSTAVASALAAAIDDGHLYPPKSCEPLRSTIARYWGLARDNVLLSNGADEMLLIAALGLRARGPRAGVSDRTFAGHEHSLRVAGYEVAVGPLDHTGLVIDQLVDAAARSDVLFVCNPHNPTGSVLSPSELDQLVSAAADHGCILVLDEAYGDFADPELFGSGIPALRSGANLIVIRSLSKSHGLAGLRCGYGLATADTIRTLETVTVGLPFRVNHFALIGAQVAIGETERLETTVVDVRETRRSLEHELRARGIEALDSQTNFVLARPRTDTDLVLERLNREHGIQVRDASSLGFPGWMRIGVCLPSDLPTLLAAIDAVDSIPRGHDG